MEISLNRWQQNAGSMMALESLVIACEEGEVITVVEDVPYKEGDSREKRISWLMARGAFSVTFVRQE